jgi:predicted nucleotidyltransferase
MYITIPPKRERKLRLMGVAAVYLFGSYADETAGEYSDVDLGIVMHDPATVSRSVSTHERYQALYTFFTSLPTLSDKKLDIVFLQRASLELRAHVVRTGKILFDMPTRINDWNLRNSRCVNMPILHPCDRWLTTRYYNVMNTRPLRKESIIPRIDGITCNIEKLRTLGNLSLAEFEKRGRIMLPGFDIIDEYCGD